LARPILLRPEAVRAGYIALVADGPNLRLTGICERDFGGPRLADAVFINGEPVRPFANGKCADLTIPWDADITYIEFDFIPLEHGRIRMVPHLVRIVPFYGS
jgi:hypothetical protein